MNVTLRPLGHTDLDASAHIVHRAFTDIAERHGFPPSFPTIDVATRVVRLFLDIPVIVGLGAEMNGRLAGALFLDEGDEIRSVVVVAVDPASQRRGIGRQLMEAALERARGAAGVRLVQEGYNVHALALYASLGFEVKEPLVRVSGRPRSAMPADVQLRRLGAADLDECAQLCRQVHGIDRREDLRDGIRLFEPFGIEREGRITAYTYAVPPASLTWGVAETEADMHALITGIGNAIDGPVAFLLPTRQASLLRWCLGEGFQIEKPMTLMAMGAYHTPRGCYFPSGFY